MKKHWRTIHLTADAQLERLGMTHENAKDGDFFNVYKRNGVDNLIGFSVGRQRSCWYIPINNQLWVVWHNDVLNYSLRDLKTTQEEANDHNTSLFTCRHCGHWLRPSDDGFGTLQGWCGCLEA